MKTRARLLSIVLAAVTVIGSAIPAFAAPAEGGYQIELNQVGSFSQEGISIYQNSFLEIKGENEAYVYSKDGKKVFPDAVKNAHYLERGMFEYTKAEGSDVNSNALVSADGDFLIPFEYAFYAWPGEYNNRTQNRFILAYYGTEETEDDDDYLFYTTEDMVAIGEAGKNDTLYKGYVKIYDIQNQKFVSGLEFDHVDKYDTINIVGNSILIENPDETHTLYDADGNKLADLNSRVEFSENVIIERSETNSGCRVYDDTGKEIYKSGESLSPLNGTSGYLYYYDSGKYVVIDTRGNKILTADSIYSESDNTFKTKGDGPYIILDENGKELGQTDGECTEVGYGRYFLETGVKTYTFVGHAGTLAEDVKSETYNIYTKDGELICLNDGTGFLTYSSDANYRVFGYLLYVDPGNGDDPALYDMFTGKKLLDDGFSDVTDLDGRIILTYRDGPDYTYKTFDVSITESK
jgi:hypothetical protein